MDPGLATILGAFIAGVFAIFAAHIARRPHKQHPGDLDVQAKSVRQLDEPATVADPISSIGPQALFGEPGKNWGWFLAFGILSVSLGTIGLGMTFALTAVSISFFGVLLIVGGVFQLVAYETIEATYKPSESFAECLSCHTERKDQVGQMNCAGCHTSDALLVSDYHPAGKMGKGKMGTGR